MVLVTVALIKALNEKKLNTEFFVIRGIDTKKIKINSSFDLPSDHSDHSKI